MVIAQPDPSFHLITQRPSVRTLQLFERRRYESTVQIAVDDGEVYGVSESPSARRYVSGVLNRRGM